MISRIVFEDVSLSFDSHELFKGLSCELTAGKIIGITGRNGSGKSTFLKLAGQILRPDSGEVKVFDGDKLMTRTEVAERLAAITPEMRIYDSLTAQENLKFFARLRGITLTDEGIRELGGRVGLDLETFSGTHAGNFSTGMLQRLKFAILLSVNAEVLLLDEPTANLDGAGRESFFGEIGHMAREGKLILVATNDGAEVEICDEVINLPRD